MQQYAPEPYELAYNRGGFNTSRVPPSVMTATEQSFNCEELSHFSREGYSRKPSAASTTAKWFKREEEMKLEQERVRIFNDHTRVHCRFTLRMKSSHTPVHDAQFDLGSGPVWARVQKGSVWAREREGLCVHVTERPRFGTRQRGSVLARNRMVLCGHHAKMPSVGTRNIGPVWARETEALCGHALCEFIDICFQCARKKR